MRLWVRVVLVIGVLLLVVLVAAVSTGIWTARRSFPQTDGEIELAGLAADVDVVRDEYGVPHVYADSAKDLFLAQGYIHAQDRFFEMDFRRHVTAGRLSELFGESTVDTDEFVRTMGWRRVAEREVALLDADVRDYLEAYAAGVNAYLQDRSPAEISLEYAVLAIDGLDYVPEPWTPVDSLAWLKAMAWDLSSNIDDEIGRVLATQTVSRGQIAELYPPYPYRLRAPIVESGAVVDGRFEQGTSAGPAPAVVSAAVLDSLRGIRKAAEGMPQLVGTGPGIGSNSWVVSGDHTNTGQPILANDPHLAPSIPGIWYQMGLHCRTLTSRCPFDVGGFTFSGLPGVVIGHNQRIAWGFTNLAADVADLYLERVDDRAGTYRYGGQARALSTRTETIRVADGEDVEITVRSTGHGPLLSDVDEEMSEVAVRAGAPAIALCWTALDPRGTANALFALNRAGSWEEFRAAARQFAVPPQNMVYADVDGHIGYQAPGAIPIRRTGDGRWPAPGWNPAYDWQREYVPFDALPRMLDPDSGVVVAANQAVIGPGYPYYLGESWSYGYRSQRLSELIEADRSLSAEDMTAMQLDSRSAAVDELLPYLLDIDLGRPYIRQGQRVLRQWDRAQEADSAGAAFFNMVWRSLLERTFHDQLPEEVWPERGDRWHEVVRRLLEQPRNAWWDDTTTEEERETRDDILVASLVDARYEITRRIASDPRLWAWGDLHRLELVHPSLGRSGVSAVEWLFNRGPAEVGGGEAVVNATGWSALEDFSVIWAPSMRMVVSVGDFDESRWINQSGASGHAFNGHYDDQFPLWAEGETIAWPFSRAAVDDAAEDSLVLTPAGS